MPSMLQFLVSQQLSYIKKNKLNRISHTYCGTAPPPLNSHRSHSSAGEPLQHPNVPLRTPERARARGPRGHLLRGQGAWRLQCWGTGTPRAAECHLHGHVLYVHTREFPIPGSGSGMAGGGLCKAPGKGNPPVCDSPQQITAPAAQEGTWHGAAETQLCCSCVWESNK